MGGKGSTARTLPLTSPRTPSGVSRAPIIYSDGYNISFWGMENLHPFDSKKYEKVFKQLVEEKVIVADQVYAPAIANENQLLTVHTPEYLDSLSSSVNVAGIVEVPPVAMLPISTVRTHVLEPMLLATGGTVLGAHLAAGLRSPLYCMLKDERSIADEKEGKRKLPSSRWHHDISKIAEADMDTAQSMVAAEEKRPVPNYGWSINLSGGYHHACSNAGGGFCVYSDISIAILSVATYSSRRKFMIVDLDAHQGNGHERDKLLGVFTNGVRVFTLDMYNGSIYPHDTSAKPAIDCRVELRSGTGDDVYLPLLTKHLQESMESFQPDMVIYNAGTDCLAGDPLGRLNISPEGIVQRDEIVFRECFSRNVPVLMVLSGGYQKTNAAVIARSITNLDKQFGLIENGITGKGTRSTGARSVTSASSRAPDAVSPYTSISSAVPQDSIHEASSTATTHVTSQL